MLANIDLLQRSHKLQKFKSWTLWFSVGSKRSSGPRLTVRFIHGLMNHCDTKSHPLFGDWGRESGRRMNYSKARYLEKVWPKKMGAVVFRRDPCGFTCLLMTYGAVAYADYVVIRWILLATMFDSPWFTVHLVAFNLIVILLFVSHARAVFSDPGIVPLPSHPIDFSDAHIAEGKNPNLPPPDEDWTICTRCEMYRPPRAHHCRICQRCIRRMDHHCPWINNCVGERNQKYFLQFLFYVGLLAVYSIGMFKHSLFLSTEAPSVILLVHHTIKRLFSSFFPKFYYCGWRHRANCHNVTFF